MPLALMNAPALLSPLPELDAAASSSFEVQEPSSFQVREPSALPKGLQGVSRRPGREQGLALEHLGHAVEYLIDSRMFLTGIAYTRAEEQALQMLMAASREVFESCPATVSWSSAIRARVVCGWNGMFARTNPNPRS